MVHVFPYSKREGTLASEMEDQIPDSVKRGRCAYLSEVARSIRKEILDEIITTDNTCTVLFETFKNGRCVGHTDHFLEVEVEHATPLDGMTLPVRLTSHNDERCFGTLL